MGCGSSKPKGDDAETRAPQPSSGASATVQKSGGGGGGGAGTELQPQSQSAAQPNTIQTPPGHNSFVFFDVVQAGQPLGRLTIELDTTTVPRTAENFRQFCTGEYSEKGKVRGYKGSVFHRVIPGFMAQGGDILNGDGTGKISIYGGKGKGFEDEGFQARHEGRGTLSMANSGPNTNGSQFFLTFGPTPHLDGKHVVFGRVIQGQEVLDRIERTRIGELDRPVQEIVIADCGQLA